MGKYAGLYLTILTLCLVMAVASIPQGEARPVYAAPKEESPAALPQGIVLGMEGLPTQMCLIHEEKLWAGKMMLVDKTHPLPPEAAPPNTLSVAQMGAAARSAHTVAAQETGEALAQWFHAARHRGFSQPVAWAGTRSNAQQLDWQLEQLALYAQSMPLTDAAQRVAGEREAPGCSEHQTGWAVDIRLCSGYAQEPDGRPLEAGEAGRYLLDTAWRYGFIHRYRAHPCPEEAYHFRYVGLGHAWMIHALGLPFESYLAFLHEAGALRYYQDGELKYAILCEPVKGDWQLRKPAGLELLDASYDNQGYAIALFGQK